jgi:predicted amidophosphoribosyltransferase
MAGFIQVCPKCKKNIKRWRNGRCPHCGWKKAAEGGVVADTRRRRRQAIGVAQSPPKKLEQFK